MHCHDEGCLQLAVIKKKDVIPMSVITTRVDRMVTSFIYTYV